MLRSASKCRLAGGDCWLNDCLLDVRSGKTPSRVVYLPCEPSQMQIIGIVWPCAGLLSEVLPDVSET